jgi:hypothetical protein
MEIKVFCKTKLSKVELMKWLEEHICALRSLFSFLTVKFIMLCPADKKKHTQQGPKFGLHHGGKYGTTIIVMTPCFALKMLAGITGSYSPSRL